ncbi:MAG: gliding motility-associated C-terminal domain-containing protein [Chitinophagales bacterium]
MKNKIILLISFIVCSQIASYAQIYSMSGNSGQTITACRGVLRQTPTDGTSCYNNVGSNNYSNNVNQTVTICSGTPGKPVRVSFLWWDLETNYDFLYVYDGPTTASPLIGTITGSGDIYNPHSPRSYTSSGTCLTFQFVTDGSTRWCGFESIIGCAPDACGTNTPANDLCGAAPQICDLNGYCGNTSGWYTQDNGTIGTTGSPAGPFCGSIENNSWISFIASATTATLNINSYNCAYTTSGIQVQVFSTTNCSSFTSKSNCVSQNTGSGAFTVTATGLTIGQKYYLMIDGFAGNICDYTVAANTGVQVITLTSNPSNATICQGQTATIKVNGAPAGTTFSWTPTGSIIGSTTDSIVTVQPGTTTTYSCQITLPNGCGIQTENYTITVNQKTTPTFTQLGPYCVGNTPGTLPTTSSNGITGTWSPSTISTAAPGNTTYTFTPTAGLCANSTTMTVTVNANVTPTFNPVAPICTGDVLNPLPTTSTNGINGTWSPALNNTATTTYTFSPTAGQCANSTTLTITVNQKVTPTFNPVAPICSGTVLNPLPTTSTNGINGSWSPALNNTATTTYTFTPIAGQCANTTTLTITVNQKVTPTFNPVAPICSGDVLNPLPTTSTNGIPGTWSPALNNTGTTTYTFTPTAGQCANTTTLTITVNQKVTPTFNAVAPICSGTVLNPLPTTSTNGINGTWSPALNNTATTTYTFTPTAGQCANTTTLTITVNQKVTPTFNPVAPICSGGNLSPLPTTSTNGITGTWSPALNNTSTTTYTFTPTAGQCANSATLTININSNTTPTFNQIAPICSGDVLNPLPTTSTNGINGSWSPALNNTATTTYTFTPTAGQCATSTTLTVTVNQKVTPTFNQVAPICSGDVLNPLPTTSTNGIPGTWSPALNNTATTTYTFTPTAGQCANTTTLTITVNQKVTPAFTPVTPICSGTVLNPLPTTSTNGINGTWSPALNNTATTTYTFTPTAGQCANTTTLTITVNQKVTPTFNAVAPICPGGTLNPLPTTSTNGITGTWSPALNNTATTTYTFTPTAGQCANSTTLTITVNQNTVPTFNQVAPICSGDVLNPLPTTSTNGINGTWSPALNNTATTTYTFTPTAGQCATSATLTVTVNQKVTPTFNQVGPICSGTVLNPLPTTSTNGINGTWSPALNNTATTTYTFTPTAGQCANSTTLTITVNQKVTPTFNAVAPICSGGNLSPLPTTSTNGITGTWSPALNNTNTTTYTFTPTAGQCANTATLTINVNSNTTPTFNPVAPICSGGNLSPLPTTSTNGITGTWSPALNNTNTTTYTFTPTAGQCATSATLTINVLPTRNSRVSETICEGDSIVIGTQAFYTTGTFPVVLQSSQGCDSTVTLSLTVNPTKDTVLNKVICEGDTVILNNTPFTTTGQFDIKLQTSLGCDSIIRLNLTVLDTSIKTYVTTICDGQSVTIGGQTFTDAGIYTIRLQNSNGCDSTIILDLRIKPVTTTDIEKVICQGEVVVIGSQTFSVTGTYTVTLTSSIDCDSIINLDLKVNPVSRTDLSFIVCNGEAIAIGDSVFTATGNYTVILENSLGCDSVITLDLTVNPTFEETVSRTICEGDSVTIGSQVFKDGGDYTVVLKSALQCDSTINLKLTVLPKSSVEINKSICAGESFTVGTQTFNESGDYTVVLQNASGCDSTVMLSLTVNPLPVIDAVADKAVVNTGEEVQLNVTTTEQLNFSWIPANVVSNASIQNPTATLTEPTMFIVTAINRNTSCSSKDSVFVELNELSCSKENIFIPNAFTPNGDGINDVFIPRSLILKSMKLGIFNKWGNKVFETDDLTQSWDGNYKGQPAEPGTYGYFFVGECVQGEKININGNITLLR